LDIKIYTTNFQTYL